MIKVLVTVGIYYDKHRIQENAISYEIPAIPQIGSVIIPDWRLDKLIEEKRKKWNMSKRCRLNYVKTVAYLESNDKPIIMLSANPAHYIVDIMYGNQSLTIVLPSIPRRGDEMFVPEFEDFELVVNSITYESLSTTPTIYLVRE